MTASAQAYLVQRAERLRLAVKEIRGEFEHIEKTMKSVQNDLILLLSAIDDFESERNQPEIQ